MLNIFIMFVTFVALGVWAYLVLVRTKRDGPSYSASGGKTMTMLLDCVKEEIAELVKDDTFTGGTEQEYRNALGRKAKIITTLRESGDGKDSAKEVVIDLIYNIVTKECPTEQDLKSVIPFGTDSLNPHVKFEILMYHFKRQLTAENWAKPENERQRNPDKFAFRAWVEKYKLAEVKYIIEDGKRPSYAITNEEVDRTYDAEKITLDYPDMAKIVATLLFQRYKGFGCIDTLRALEINGLTIGTSGSILTYLRAQSYTMTQSVWVNYGGKYVHARFLDFGSMEEMRRVVQLLSRYNSPGPLTEKRGYIVNNMYDESRILATRPPFTESWAAFIRKFGTDDKTLHFLIYKDYITDWDLPLNMIRYLMKGQVTSSFTGRQGSGKTVMMAATIQEMDPRHNLRVIEMAFELNLREKYPERNILTFQETEFLPASHAQDAQKKSDGAVSLFGEVATDQVAARMIQTGRVASLYTIFSHHAKTAADAVYALADSIVAATGMNDRSVAEKQVIDVLRVDVHLDYTAEGKRFVERITEIIKLPEGVGYDEYEEGDDRELYDLKLRHEYYTRRTDRKTFETQDIIRYDLDTDTYYPVAPPSKGLLQDMWNCMDRPMREEFNAWMMRWFNVDCYAELRGSADIRPAKSNAPEPKAERAGFSRAAMLGAGGV